MARKFDNPWGKEHSLWFNDERDKWTKKNQFKSEGNVYYTIDGYYLGSDNNNSNNVYVLDTPFIGVCEENNNNCIDAKFLNDLKNKGDFPDKYHTGSTDPFVTKLNITVTTFNFFVGVTRDEDSDNVNASNAIASTFLNNWKFKLKYKKTSLISIINKISTVSNKIPINPLQLSSVDRIAIEGTILALKGIDYSNGSTHWDGFDFAGKGKNHTKVINQGVLMKKKHISPFIDVWSKGNLLEKFSGGTYKSVHQSLYFSEEEKKFIATGYNKGRVLYITTAQIGKSIFYGPNLKAIENENYNWQFF